MDVVSFILALTAGAVIATALHWSTKEKKEAKDKADYDEKRDNLEYISSSTIAKLRDKLSKYETVPPSMVDSATYIWDYKFPEVVISRSIEDMKVSDELSLSEFDNGRIDSAIAKLKFYFMMVRQNLDRTNGVVEMDNADADIVWHNFILDTEQYHKFCMSAFGRYIHHIPNTSNKLMTRESVLNIRDDYRNMMTSIKRKNVVLYDRIHTDSASRHSVSRNRSDEDSIDTLGYVYYFMADTSSADIEKSISSRSLCGSGTTTSSCSNSTTKSCSSCSTKTNKSCSSCSSSSCSSCSSSSCSSS